MITLSNTKYGSKRKAIISGFSQWDNLSKSATVLFYVQIMNNNEVLLDDLSINQNRSVIYNLNNNNLVDVNFNPVESGGTGEYDFFWNMIVNKIDIIEILLQLGLKLKQRGIFD